MYSKYNISVISILSILYILLITKISEILTTDNNQELDNEKYSATVFFLSILSITVAYLCFSDLEKNNNFIFNKTINFSSIILLIYITTFHWDDFDDYYKLTILSLAFLYIIYLINL